MSQFVRAALLALPLVAGVEQKAFAWGCCCECGQGQSHFFPCLGIVPGPWYSYWPTGPGGEMTSSGYYGQWKYPNHFQTPAPIPVGESFCSDYGGGFYPSYWYGR